MASQNNDEQRNIELRARRDAYAAKTPADDAQARDFQHFQRLANDEIVARKGTK